MTNLNTPELIAIEESLTNTPYNRTMKSLKSELVSLCTSDVDKIHLNWVRLLIGSDYKKIVEYLKIYDLCNSVPESTMKYRRQIRSEGRGIVCNNKILRHYESGNVDMVRASLQEKCLEYVTIASFEKIINRIDGANLLMQDVLDDMDCFPNMRMMSFVL